MKNIIFTLTLFMTLMCFSQTVKPLYLKKGLDITGYYYQDVDNDFNRFEGTWLYSNGNTTLKIIFRKKLNIFISRSGTYYVYLVGEYRYVVNGVEKVNTLGRIDSPFSDPFGHAIAGTSIIRPGSAPVCNDCTSDERRVALQFTDPERPGVMEGLSGNVIIRRIDTGSIQKIQLILKQTGSIIPDDAGIYGPNSFNVPWGTYVLTKVE